MAVRRKTPREIADDMLEHWGEWERLGIYAAKAQVSILGRLISDGPGAPCGASGSRPPPGLMIPSDVLLCGRILAHMKESGAAGVRYYRAIHAHYVGGDKSGPDAYYRGVSRFVQLFISRQLQNCEKESI